MKMANADYKPTLRISEVHSSLPSSPMALLPPLPFFLCTESKRRGRSLKSG